MNCVKYNTGSKCSNIFSYFHWSSFEEDEQLLSFCIFTVLPLFLVLWLYLWGTLYITSTLLPEAHCTQLYFTQPAVYTCSLIFSVMSMHRKSSAANNMHYSLSYLWNLLPFQLVIHTSPNQEVNWVKYSCGSTRTLFFGHEASLRKIITIH